MKHKLKLLTLLIVVSTFAFGQENKILVSQTTVKVNSLGSEELYFGFDEGDEIIFNYELVKGKDLKEIEIFEYPNASIFMDYKTKEIKDKSIIVNKKGIYKFKFKNSAISARICKVKIERIPANPEVSKFNTTVYWQTLRDTNYYFVDEKYLISKDTSVVPFGGKRVEEVSSRNALNGNPNRLHIKATLPENTISWSYYLGVGNNAESVFKDAEEKAKKKVAQLNTASSVASKLAVIDPTGSAALASLALKGYAEFGVTDNADNVKYWFVNDYANAQLFMAESGFYAFDKGNGPLIAKRMTTPLKGTFYLCLENDNFKDLINVHIRMSAVVLTEKWGVRKVERFKVKTWKEPYLK